MPKAPDYTNKTQVKVVKRALKHYQTCANIKEVGIKVLETCFPECLRLLKTDQGLPPHVALKNALAHVLDNTMDDTERQQEYLRYSDEITRLTYTHQPHSLSLPIFFGELERLHKLQHLVTPANDTGISYNSLKVRAHMRIFEGIGGRRDMVQELKYTEEGSNMDRCI